ncbi:hypothetical protein [Glycomyces sp. MUSA5-2]|uniref:hypothetical protein n=1 Tax=Glycomyces sp. MUSA5-2 TaxID=2053002 RepID=UPI00300831E5
MPTAVPPGTGQADRLAAAARLAAEADGEAVYRAFADELAAVLAPQALALAPGERAACWAAAAELADAHLTEELRRRLPTEKRVRISLAQRREHSLLEAAIGEPAPRFLVEDGRLFARYAGFRDPSRDLPDEWFEAATERVTVRFARGLRERYLVWTGVRREDYAVEHSFFLPVEGLDAGAVRVGAVRLPEGAAQAPRAAVPAGDGAGPEIEAEVEVRPEGALTAVTARLPTERLTALGVGRWELRAYATLREFTYDLPLNAPRGFFQKGGFPRGLTAEPGPRRALSIRVDERALLRGLSRIKLLDFRK